MKYYLAYGSNLNKRQMDLRCPDAVPIGTVTIKDYELVFRGVATIEPKRGAEVQCGIWKISAEDERHLDVYEGYPRLYVKQDFWVEVGGELVRAMAYVMVNGVRGKRPPSTEYLRTIMEGYEDFGLDDKPLIVAAAKQEE
jgi:hypothetical protein